MKTPVTIAFALCVQLWLLPGLNAQAPVGWKLVWAEEFDQPDGSSPDPAKWTFDLGGTGWGNNELQYYTSRTNNARIENGQLVIEAQKETYQSSLYTSARLKTQGKVSWTYGRIEARIKLPRGQGIWPAFWMLGASFPSVGWPKCGEVDIMENIGKEPSVVHGTVHGPGYSGGGAIGGPYSLPGGAPFADDYHVYAVEWTTNQIKWFVDGSQYFSVNPAKLPTGTSWVFTQPQFVLLNLAVGGNWPGNPDSTTTFPQRMLVDYVRVYTPSALTVGNGNQLRNAGFEGTYPTHWTLFGAGFNTTLAVITNSPVHDGTNAFKLFGQFTGTLNDSGLFQDVVAAAGQSFRASGWMLTPSGDAIAGENTAWMEVTFRDASDKMLALYRSTPLTSRTPVGVWMKLPVTNQFSLATFTPVGSVSTLIAPAGTAFARFQITFRQPLLDPGSVRVDDLTLLDSGASEVPVAVSVTKAASNLNLSFSTFLGLTYEVRYKNSLADPTWVLMTTTVGDGSVQLVADDPATLQRFYQVAVLCN